MHIYRNDVKDTMTGLQEAQNFVEEIHQKAKELQDLLYEFQNHCLAVGIDIVRTQVPNEAETMPTD